MPWNFLKKICYMNKLCKLQDELLYLEDYVPIFLFLSSKYTHQRIKFTREHCDNAVFRQTSRTSLLIRWVDDEDEGRIIYALYQLTRFLLQHPKYKSMLIEESIKKYSIYTIPDKVFKELPYNDILNEISYLGYLYEIQEKLINFKEYVPVFLFLTNESYEKRMNFLKENKLEDILKRTKKSTQNYLNWDDSAFAPYDEKRFNFANELEEFISKLEKFTKEYKQFKCIPIETLYHYIEEFKSIKHFGLGFILYYGKLLDPLCNFWQLLDAQKSLIELDSYVPIFLYITQKSLKLRMDYLQKIKQEDLMEQYRESLNYFYPEPNLDEANISFAIEMKYFLEEFPEFKKIINYESVDYYMKNEKKIGTKKWIPSYDMDTIAHVNLEEVYPIKDFYIK